MSASASAVKTSFPAAVQSGEKHQWSIALKKLQSSINDSGRTMSLFRQKMLRVLRNDV